MIDAYGVVEPRLATRTSGFSMMEETGFYMVGTDDIILNDTMTDEEKMIFVIRENGAITQRQISQKIGVALRTVKRMTVELQKKGKIVRVGNSRTGEWRICE